MNLIKKIDLALLEYKLPSIKKVISNKKQVDVYINKLFKKFNKKVIIQFQLLKFYDYRIKHILFSLGLGLVLCKFKNIKYFLANIKTVIFFDYG